MLKFVGTNGTNVSFIGKIFSCLRFTVIFFCRDPFSLIKRFQVHHVMKNKEQETIACYNYRFSAMVPILLILKMHFRCTNLRIFHACRLFAITHILTDCWFDNWIIINSKNAHHWNSSEAQKISGNEWKIGNPQCSSRSKLWDTIFSFKLCTDHCFALFIKQSSPSSSKLANISQHIPTHTSSYGPTVSPLYKLFPRSQRGVELLETVMTPSMHSDPLTL